MQIALCKSVLRGMYRGKAVTTGRCVVHVLFPPRSGDSMVNPVWSVATCGELEARQRNRCGAVPRSIHEAQLRSAGIIATASLPACRYAPYGVNKGATTLC